MLIVSFVYVLPFIYLVNSEIHRFTFLLIILHLKLKDPGNFLARELPGETSTFQEYDIMRSQMSSYLNNVVEQGEPPFKPLLVRSLL